MTTDDGYILTLFRIPGEKGDSSTGKPPVFMQHGITSSAFAWISNTADIAPAFVAAKAGYDVWLGNSRGNQYSNTHEKLDPENDDDAEAYWDFDWEQMGDYDLPASFDYLLKENGNEKLAYIGHSQGTT